MCLNEEEMLPFFLDYYTNYVGVDKIVFHDGGSVDNTHNIINSYPNTELILEHDDVTDSIRDLRIWNEEWKRYRNDYDWMIVCTTDEFLYHPDIKNKLIEYKQKGITIPLIEGFEMISLEFPKSDKGNFLPNQIKTGIKEPLFLNKKLIFSPKDVDINYLVGCHLCNPTGNVVYSEKEEFKLLHFKWLSHDFLVRDSMRKHNRLSDSMRNSGMGLHYKLFTEKTYDEYLDRYNRTVDVLKQDTNTNYLMNRLTDITFIKLDDGKIRIYLYLGEPLDSTVNIRNLDGNIIYSEKRVIDPDVEFWCIPNDKSYLNGFTVEITNNKDGYTYKSKIIRNNLDINYGINVYLYKTDSYVDKIFFRTSIDIDNVSVVIRNNGQIIYCEKNSFKRNINYWFNPDNKSYLDGFTIELINIENKTIFKKDVGK